MQETLEPELRSETAGEEKPEPDQRGDVRSVALVAGLLVGLTGVVGAVASQPLLAPPLGVSAYLGARDPKGNDASFRVVPVAHAVGLAAGALASSLLHVLGIPGTHSVGTAAAAAFAVVATVLGMETARARHSPALATTLLVTSGGIATVRDAAGLLCGATCIVAAFAVLRSRPRTRAPRSRPPTPPAAKTPIGRPPTSESFTESIAHRPS